MAPPLAQSSPPGKEDQGRRVREKGKVEGNRDDPGDLSRDREGEGCQCVAAVNDGDGSGPGMGAEAERVKWRSGKTKMHQTESFLFLKKRDIYLIKDKRIYYIKMK